MELNIPLRPKKFDNTAIRKADADCLTYLVLYGCKNEDAFARFHPEFIDLSGRLNETGKKASRQFFNYAKHKQYIDDYKETLADFLGRQTASNDGLGVEIDESRKDKALKSLLDKAMTLVESGSDLDAESLKVISDIFRKLNLLKDDVERPIAPIRVLPVRCKSECRYWKFIATAKADKQIFDDCDYCKARKFAEAHGFVYDPCKVLDLPDDVIVEIESHNDVKLLDILNGKIDN